MARLDPAQEREAGAVLLVGRADADDGVAVPGAPTAVSAVSWTLGEAGAGLAALGALKAHRGPIGTAMGGAKCEGPMGAAIHELFPSVD